MGSLGERKIIEKVKKYLKGVRLIKRKVEVDSIWLQSLITIRWKVKAEIRSEKVFERQTE